MTQEFIVNCAALGVGVLVAWLLRRLPALSSAALALACLLAGRRRRVPVDPYRRRLMTGSSLVARSEPHVGILSAGVRVRASASPGDSSWQTVQLAPEMGCRNGIGTGNCRRAVVDLVHDPETLLPSRIVNLPGTTTMQRHFCSCDYISVTLV